MARIRIASPEGAVAHHRRDLARCPTTLDGRRVVILENGKPNARLLLTSVADGLRERHGMLVDTVAAKETAARPGDAQLLANLRLRADVILTGSGD